MYHNGKPPISVSTLSTGRLDLRAGQAPMVACGDCGQWTVLERKIARWHKVVGTQVDCPGGGQRYALDASPAVVAAEFAAAVQDARRYRAGRSFSKPQPAVPVSVPAIARHRYQGIEAAAALARLERALA
jgi:hypothetical protein